MAYLISASENQPERIYPLKLGVNTIGRAVENDIYLEEPDISRYHAKIFLSEQEAIIEDLHSRNKTFINNVEIKKSFLQKEDIVAFGTSKYKFAGVEDGVQSNLNASESIVKQIKCANCSTPLHFLVGEVKSSKSILRLPHQDSGRAAVDKLKILLEISKQLCSAIEPDLLLNKIVELIFQVMAIDRAVILMTDEETQTLKRRAVKLKPGLTTEGQFYSTKIINLVYNTGDAVLTANAMSDRRFQTSESVLTQAIRGSMCVPLKPYDQVIGVIYVDNLQQSAAYTEEDLEFLTALANQAAVAIHMTREVHRREQELKQQVLELQIQVDQAKKDQEVAEIVNADYFKRIAAKAEQLKQANQSQ